MTDTREQPLNEIVREIISDAGYDPNFAGIEIILEMETKLFSGSIRCNHGFV